jgi:alpha-methylacyl-CoA racemase
MSRADWPAMKDRVDAIFRTKTRAEWCEIMEGSDVCFAPVLRPSEAPNHPHNVHRSTFVDVGGVVQPGPSPRFERTPTTTPTPAAHAGQHTDEVLTAIGFDADDITKLRDTGAVA